MHIKNIYNELFYTGYFERIVQAKTTGRSRPDKQNIKWE